MKGNAFWVVSAIVVIVLIFCHVTAHGEGFFEPVANVYLTLDEHATEAHCFEGQRLVCEQARTGYAVRGGTLHARVTGISDLGTEDGVHRAYASVAVDFNIDNRYDGWGFSRLDRPILYGFAIGATSEGEGTDRHVRNTGDATLFRPVPAPPRTRYAPTLDGACSTDYRHDLCRFRATVPITGDTRYLLIQLRERFR